LKLIATQLPGVIIAHTEVRSDSRGSFTRLFCEEDLRSALSGRHVVQINYSRTLQCGAIRGLHYQNPPFAETKLVRCLRGAVWDVAVDLRANSPTFLAWHAVSLTAENANMVIVPQGCAHGFQALTPECELLYLHTAPFTHHAEAGVAWNDRRIDVRWPLPLPAEGGLSERDRSLPALEAGFEGLRP
jgi:dTDP-4-dehydrorhamnose 3,5-epimerase